MKGSLIWNTQRYSSIFILCYLIYIVYKIAHDLRSLNNKINIDVQLSEGSLKSKMRRANKDNADYAVVIVGEDELESGDVIVKSLSDQNSEQSNMKLSDLRDFISNLK